MIFTVDFESDESLYRQLCRQIILGIANDEMHNGDSLPSVRAMAQQVGINMHTVNKAYSILREEGYIQLDRSHGAIICLDIDRMRAMEELSEELHVCIAKAMCRNVSRDEIHDLIDHILEEFGCE